ncbi:hypothetical protein OS190_15255 [Sulfitobacter sp. F26204]|nr:hypothetical protein [Sulfitobacter sp. F26204]MCX7560928.1 hypothetical protein [Sulfitobacter sp. F26204]
MSIDLLITVSSLPAGRFGPRFAVDHGTPLVPLKEDLVGEFSLQRLT